VAVFARGNCDTGVLFPIVKTLMVVVALWAAIAIVLVDSLAPTSMVSYPFTWATLVHVSFNVFLDAAVNASWWFQVLHATGMIVALGVDLFATVFLLGGANEDALLVCFGGVGGEPYTALEIKRILLFNLLTSLLPGTKVTCCDPHRRELRFAEVPVVRSNFSTLISEDAATTVLKDLQLRALELRDRRSHVEHLLFQHAPGERTKLASPHHARKKSESALGFANPMRHRVARTVSSPITAASETKTTLAQSVTL
jgi:hypothetical protein